MSVAKPAEAPAKTSNSNKQLGVTCTWYEGNSWRWDVGGVKLLVDPVFSTLDFGMPAFFYSANKKVFNNYEEITRKLAGELDHILITQGLADHCCPQTHERLVQLVPESVRVVAPPSAEETLSKYWPDNRVTYIKPNQSLKLKGANGDEIEVSVIRGSLVGPPWQSPENAYIVKCTKGSGGTIFYEPHCMWREEDVQNLSADVVMTPTYGQQVGPSVAHYTILNSGERAVALARSLGASHILSFNNADADAKGLLTKIVTQTGDKQQFQQLAQQAGISYVQAVPGEGVSL